MKTAQLLPAFLLAASVAGPARVRAAAAGSKLPSLKPCVRKKGKSFEEPPTLDQLVQCQSKNMMDFIEAYERKTGQEPPDSLVDRLDSRQRGEVRDYLQRHPHRASVNLKPSELRQGASVGDGSSGETREPGESEEYGGGYEGPKKRSGEEPTPGGAITPEIARDLVKTLSDQQGGNPSPEIKQLQAALKRDGSVLSDDTLAKLKQAAQTAKRQGLDLNVPEEVEKFLLDSGGSGQAYPAPSVNPPGANPP